VTERYAFESSRHSSPLLAIPCDDGVVLATVQYYSRHPHRRQQTRFVELLLGGGGTFNRTVAVVGLSGVIADNIALLQHARRYIDSWTRSYGSTSSQCNPARQIAHVVGDACQSHALGGGVRPYGASLLVCSVQQGQPPQRDGIEPLQPSTLATFAITHPSGAVYSTSVSPSKQTKNNNPNLFIVGGSADVQTKLRQRVKDLLSNTQQQKQLVQDSSFKRTVHVAVEALLEEYDRNRREQQQQQPEEDDEDVEMEILIMSPTHGSHRLSPHDAKLLVSRIREQQRLLR
jgi:20S proteasome alpha/beta subunit